MKDCWLKEPELFYPDTDFATETETIIEVIESHHELIIHNRYCINEEAKPFIYLIDQVQKFFAPIVLICGKQRMGKSSYGLTMLDTLHYVFHKAYIDPKNITKFVYFNARLFLEEAITVSKSIIIIDEASKDLSKSEWYTAINQVISKIIETQGDLNNIYIIILPHASRLAPQHKIYIDLKVVMKRRGEAKVFFMKKDHGELSGDIRKVSRQIFWGIWKLPKPPIELWNAYEKLSTERKREIATEEMNKLHHKEKDWKCFCGTQNTSSTNTCVHCGGAK
jgi:hypothetical protein